MTTGQAAGQDFSSAFHNSLTEAIQKPVLTPILTPNSPEMHPNSQISERHPAPPRYDKTPEMPLFFKHFQGFQMVEVTGFEPATFWSRNLISQGF